jgi:hypothetical protein
MNEILRNANWNAVYAVGEIVSVLVTLGVGFWRLSAKLTLIHAALSQVLAGRGPACISHALKIQHLQDVTEMHEKRLDVLEAGEPAPEPPA